MRSEDINECMETESTVVEIRQPQRNRKVHAGRTVCGS
jgi:hypothetical protein